MRAGWYRFWSWGAWQGWVEDRRRLHAHRGSVERLRNTISVARSDLAAAEVDRRAAERRGRWVARLKPRDLPLPLPQSEIGLETVEGVALLEQADGGVGWTVVDRGSVHFTDRRMVFSGSKDVTFRFSDITVDRPCAEGWNLGVSTLAHSHVLGGPVERLMVVRTAVLDGVAGTDPLQRWRARFEHATEREQHATELLHDADVALRSLEQPPRPISPAWAPAMAAGLVGLVGVGGVLSQASPAAIEVARSATTTVAGAAPEVLGVTVTTQVDVPVRVVEVLSADELVVEMGGERQTVRLAGVSAEESLTSAARQTLHELVTGRVIEMVPEPVDGPTSFYLYADGELVNVRLVELGVAANNAVGLDLAEVFQSAEDRARAAGLGIWAPVPTTVAVPTTATPAPSTTSTQPTTTTTEAVTTTAAQCHPSYEGACVPVGVEDVDCAGGSGNGPYYVGRVTVVGPDVYGLDRDGDGIGCES